MTTASHPPYPGAMRYALLALVLSVSVACSPVDAPVRCTPNAQTTCMCSSGRQGTQTCETGGAGYTPCVCADDPADVLPVDAEAGTDAGAPEDHLDVAEASDAVTAIDAADVAQGGDAVDAGEDARTVDAPPDAAADVSDAPDAARCGLCAVRPNAIAGCAAGACAYTCEAGFADCDGILANGCEVNTRTSVGNCGGCGVLCSSRNGTPNCAAGRCAIACAQGFADCNNPADGCEVNVSTSTAHCGRCGNACPVPRNATATCVMSVCGFTCNPGFGDCDGDPANGCERPLTSDTSHCGACNRACDIPGTRWECRAGTCRLFTCSTGHADCDGVESNGCEVNVVFDRNNCGGCGVRCRDGLVCMGRVCTLGP